MQNISSSSGNDQQTWLEQPLVSGIKLRWELVVFGLIVILTIATRFYDLESRVMSHDETSHVYFSWLLYKGQGYSHDPVTHGPLQFHLVALSYFIFGDNDLSARIPAVLFSIATVIFAWSYRRYLGKAGMLVTALLFTISPYMLYYGRYVRNEAFVAFFGAVTIWVLLRYLESGENRYLFYLTTATVLHFAAKETAYIYTAQALLFMGLYFLNRITRQSWKLPRARTNFLIYIILALLLLATIGATGMLADRISETSVSGEAALPTIPGQELGSTPAAIPSVLPITLGVLALAALGMAAYHLISGYGLEAIRSERSFDILILLGTLVLPQLSSFVIEFAGWKIPVSAGEVMNLTSTEIIQMGVILVPVTLLSIAIGLWWNRRLWLVNAAIFYAVYTVLFTTLFTNGAGFFTGIVGSLGYWLAQQPVQRGSQPWYYYILIQVPIYEYLAALGSLLGLGFLFNKRIATVEAKTSSVLESKSHPERKSPSMSMPNEVEEAPVLPLLAFWVVTSILAYTIAGEKMPWLTVHIALPMILLAGFTIGKLIESTDWEAFRSQRGWLIIGLLPVFITSFSATMGSLLGDALPFQGKSLEQLGATSTFLTSALTALASGIGLGYLLKDWTTSQITRIFTLAIFALLGLLTARTAFSAAYINHDRATEFLVYAHSAPGVKVALAQIEELSNRLTGSLDMAIAYDNDTTYPYWWYLRNYTNQRYYAGNPTRDLRDVSAILVGDGNYGKIEPVVGQAYHHFDFIRIWWPNQDYYNLNWERISNALLNPEMRSAIFQIWLNRDYTQYARITGKDMSLSNWQPSGRMRLYLRKDIVSQIWSYGTAPVAETILADPYEGKGMQINADKILGIPGAAPGQFQSPRDLAFAPDGSLYIADADNHRIQHLGVDGSVIQVWGSFGDVSSGVAAAGTFNQPWGVAVGPDGSVYVADTWNHRIQKFSASGEFIHMWGYFGQAETPFAFWGPRDLAIDEDGNIFVTDTGNKRVVIFDPDGNYVAQFGSVGFDPGQFDEPVGIALDGEGNVYVADTWNQRVQVFTAESNGTYRYQTGWEIVGWYGQSLDNKPYLAADDSGHIFVTDPEGYRVLEFTNLGEFVRYWGDYGTGADGLNVPNGITIDPEGGIWVADSKNHRLVRFIVPEE